MPISDFVLDLSGSLQPTRIPVSWIPSSQNLNTNTPFQVSITTDLQSISYTYFLNLYEISQDVYTVYHAIIQYSDSSRNPILPGTLYYIQIKEVFVNNTLGDLSSRLDITTPLKASYDSQHLPDSSGSSFTYADSSGSYKVHVFTKNDDITVPANPIASVVTVYVIGAGGNGAGANAQQNHLGGGGGSGGNFIQAVQGILPNSSINISVGNSSIGTG